MAFLRTLLCCNKSPPTHYSHRGAQDTGFSSSSSSSADEDSEDTLPVAIAARKLKVAALLEQKAHISPMPIRLFRMPSIDAKLAADVKQPVEKMAAEKPAKPTTFAHQDSLKKLPIPELDETLKNYLDVVKPLQTHREHQRSIAAVKEFQRTIGPILQEKLQRYSLSQTSYIEQFWYDSYLNYDNPVVLNLNPFFLLADDPTPARNNQITRAASLVTSSLAFIRALRKEELPPDTFRGQPLCMYQFTRIFGAARIPTETSCMMQTDEKSKHLVVMCRSQFYWFDVMDDNSDLIMTEKDLVANLQAIMQDAHETPVQEAARGAVGVLSTENRRVWAGIRDHIMNHEDSVNRECLQIVDSALFILCLDDSSPNTLAEISMNMLCGSSIIEKGVQVGTCTNRWYDKLQIIVCKNGAAGINFEHTGVDGHTVLRFVSDVYTDTILRFAKTIHGGSPSLWASVSPDPAKRDPDSFGNVSTTPHKLEWTMVPELAFGLRFAETRLADLINQNEFETLEFEGYGSNYIKNMGFSPDAFVQMAFQAAYYALYGRVECTYEPAMTKQFLHGRTEAIRTVSEEVVEFVRKFCEDAPAKAKIDALKAACERHVQRTKQCAKALGQDRHLYALYCLWQRGVLDLPSNSPSVDGYVSGEEQDLPVGSPGGQSLISEASATTSTGSGSKAGARDVPAIFTDSAWDKLNTTILSTSNCGNPALRMFGFGPVSADGFGIGYIIKEDSISVCVSSKHRQTKRYVDTLHSYLQDVRYLLKQTNRKISSPSRTRAREAEARQTVAPVKPLKGGKEIVTRTLVSGTSSPSESDGEGGMLGGYGYFDVGSLNKLLNEKEEETTAGPEVASRRSIGRKLRVVDY
ncbi:hypothetical protein Dda_2992 [Drechslerella dactyloides]|uniref:Choline/carnitine acyltransferase domain-containing protein n=1 Tax=Drechslerella dactyloides TaxID=74499 RepID=A0AAD6J1Q5_DREDA|nr:hypothetical protein Dda_2992 [Drechslerella dactyloides]